MYIKIIIECYFLLLNLASQFPESQLSFCFPVSQSLFRANQRYALSANEFTSGNLLQVHSHPKPTSVYM